MALWGDSDSADQRASPVCLRTGVWIGIVGVALGLGLHLSVLDLQLLLALHRLNGLPDQLWLFLTQIGDSAVVLSLLLSTSGRSPWRCALVFKTWLLGALASPLLKAWWDTPRPLSVVDHGLLHVVGQPPSGQHAMPSGHAMAAAVLAGLWIIFWARQQPVRRWALLALAGAVALSRVAVGAHWPGDVLTGLGLGALLVVLAQVWEQKQPWSPALSRPWANGLLLGVQLVLAVLLWRQPVEGPGMALTSALTVGLAAASLLRLWVAGKASANAPGGPDV